VSEYVSSQPHLSGALEAELVPAPPPAGSGSLVVGRVSKAYGQTVAVSDMSLEISPGKVVGVIGPNGAGKSTLMRIVAGETIPDEGGLSIAGRRVDFERFSPQAAHALGVRFVHQELSLCSNLTVAENFLIEFGRELGSSWRSRARKRAHAAIELAFPLSGISPGAAVSSLTLAQRQMVEISRAASSDALSLLILDEPTSALPADRVEQLRALMDRLRERGSMIVFITHRLSEVLELTDSIVVMRGGSLAWAGAPADVTRDDLVRLMGGHTAATAERAPAAIAGGGSQDGASRRVLEVEALSQGPLREVSLHVGAGEVVGVYGLEGSGQRQLLRTVYRSGRRARSVRRRGRVRLLGESAFVSGDRRNEGIFALWSISRNLTLSALGAMARLGMIDGAREQTFVSTWLERLALRTSGPNEPVTSLSGGTQQKAIIARALGTEASLIVLDDPTRGVDAQTKADVYHLLRRLGEEGRSTLWYSTEEHELAQCDRVYVLAGGEVVDELSGPALTAERLVAAAFGGQSASLGAGAAAAAATAPSRAAARLGGRLLRQRWLVPVLAVLAMLAALTRLNGAILTQSGLELIVGAAFPLVLAALAQMLVIAAGDIDLGIGAFLGLVNVVTVTWLYDSVVYGVAAFVFTVGAYALLGALVHLRELPAIVATLGASFMWLGAALTIQPTVGGQPPSWLLDAYSVHVPLVPEPVLLTLLAAAGGYWLIARSRYGTLLRGFGNNRSALEAAGWSTLRIRVIAYAITGALGVLAGLALTAVTTSGDANASASYTLLSIAAVILGGSEFAGGIVVPVGVVAGALTLSFVGVLLSQLNVNPNYTSAVEGLILLGVLTLRGVVRVRSR
jgi:ribose transport system ATP-binding protein